MGASTPELSTVSNSIFISPQGLRAVKAERCRRSFWKFVQEMWGSIIPETPVWNWHMELIADEMQELAERVFKGLPKEYDLVINVPPGSSKSTICSIMFPVWVWTRLPSGRSICASYSDPLSLDLASRSRDLLFSDKFAFLFPEVQVRGDTKGKKLFKTTRGGSRFATSVGGSVTGMHGHFLIVDDPLNPKEAVSDADLRQATTWMDHTLPSRVLDKAVNPTIIIMQRLHEADPTGHRLDQAKTKGLPVKHICLPAELSKRVKPAKYRKKYIDGLLDPVRLSPKILREQKGKLGSWAYAAQFDQHPVPLEGGLFHVGKLKKVREPINWRYVKRAVRYWDKSASEGAGAYTVGVLFLVMHRKAIEQGFPPYVIADVVRGQFSPAVRESTIRNTAQKDGTRVKVTIEQEPGGGGKSDAEATITNLAGFNAHKDKVQTAKTLRALPFASQVEIGNVGLIVAEWNEPYVHELSLYPFSKYMDQVDASSGAFNDIASSVSPFW